MPPIAWNPVLTGAALSLALTLIGAPLIGVAAGGALAGRLSPVAPAYQGTLVATPMSGAPMSVSASESAAPVSTGFHAIGGMREN